MKKLLLIFLLGVSLLSTAQIKTDTQLQQQADSIKNATTAGFNTATRVGTMFKDIINAKVNRRDSATAYLTPYQANQDYVQLQTQNPTASISGGFDYELTSLSFFSSSVDWQIGRLAATLSAKATDSIITVNVNGFNRTFTQPSAGGTYTAPSLAVTVTANTYQNVSINVTTKDGKTAYATTVFNGKPKNYYGYSATTTPSATVIKAISGGGDFLSTAKAYSPTVNIPSGSNKHFYYSFPTSYGPLSSIKDGAGNEVIGAFTQTTVSITNASGYTQNYYCYTSNNNYSNTSIYAKYE